MENKLFETVSFHVIKPCNMKCKFCYATYNDFRVDRQLSYDEACTIIGKLYYGGVKKITFAGGEPMLYKHLNDCIKFAKSLGMTTSIITNGSMITWEWLIEMKPYLDWIGLSVDSLDSSTNLLIGRDSNNIEGIPGFTYYTLLVGMINYQGYKLKINTVVNRYNLNEDFNSFIEYARPSRWKVFQALRVEGQNDEHFDEVKVTTEEFNSFIERHKANKCIVPESNEDMTSSYLLVDPKGRFFENTLGKHSYSDSLINHSVDHCIEQISLNRDTFLKRGGIYQW